MGEAGDGKESLAGAQFAAHNTLQCQATRGTNLPLYYAMLGYLLWQGL